MEKCWIGIDPGKSGAIALISNEKVIANNFVSISASNEWLNDFRLNFDIQIAILERVNAMPKQGVNSVFKFGTNYGIWQGLLTACNVSWMLASPRVWQKGLICKNDGDDSKERSLTVARRLFPDVDLSLKKDHNRADALLIAYYAKQLS